MLCSNDNILSTSSWSSFDSLNTPFLIIIRMESTIDLLMTFLSYFSWFIILSKYFLMCFAKGVIPEGGTEFPICFLTSVMVPLNTK